MVSILYGDGTRGFGAWVEAFINPAKTDREKRGAKKGNERFMKYSFLFRVSVLVRLGGFGKWCVKYLCHVAFYTVMMMRCAGYWLIGEKRIDVGVSDNENMLYFIFTAAIPSYRVFWKQRVINFAYPPRI